MSASISSPGRSPNGSPARLVRFTGLLVDQVRDWTTGQRRRVEEYLEEFPGLQSQPEIVAGMVAIEFRLRQLDGERPTVDEYIQRLPNWAAAITRIVTPLQLDTASLDAAASTEFTFHDLGLASGPTNTLPVAPLAPKPARTWPEVPGYEVLDELGEGGMAVVYLAKHLRLNRLVALKMMQVEGNRSINTIRFEKEAEMVARLQHPNIVQIYDIGHAGTALYLALEYMPGGSLDAKWNSRPQPPLDVARVVATVARAVHHANANEILHRDLKPANVLLTRDGVAKISDFGLAKQTDAALRLTDTGLAVGTPCYMAPEQVWPRPEDVGAVTDVYGLGCILYEGLTGRPPHVGKNSLDTLRQVTDRDPLPIRKLVLGVPSGLETICMKCLEKSVKSRYASAAELADDLDRFLGGTPIQAKPISPLVRGLRWANRHRTAVALTGSLAFAVVAVAVAMAWSTYHAYRVAGALRDREFRLHGLGAKLRQLSADAGKAVSIAAAANEPDRLADYYRLEDEHSVHLHDAASLAPGPAERAGIAAVTTRMRTLREQTADYVGKGKAKQGWALIDSPVYAQMRSEYAAAVEAFSNEVDAAADAELRLVRAETYWSLRAATAVAAVLGGLGVWFLVRGLSRREERASLAANPVDAAAAREPGN